MCTLPNGWKVRDSSQKPFKSFTVTTPQGCTAVAYSHAGNPENVLYLMLEAIDKEQRKPEHHKTELAKSLQAQGYDLDELDNDNPYK